MPGNNPSNCACSLSFPQHRKRLAVALIRISLILAIASIFALPHAGIAQTQCTSAFSLRSDTPYAMGFSTNKLVELTKWVERSPARIFSLTISRNGAVIFELYSGGISRNDAHYVMSVTKSFTSALVGSALQRKYLASAETSIADMMPRRLFDDASYNRFRLVSLKNAMAMSALDAPMPPFFRTDQAKSRQMNFLRANNRLEFALQQNLLPLMGKDFQYNDITPYLIGGALQYATGKDLFNFAQDALFEPMDFSNSEWMHSDPSGISNPSYGLRVRPIDMQKFGILYLNKGCWAGSRLLPLDWVDNSFTPWIKTRANVEQPNYGWYWWSKSRSDGWTEHLANGWKGQRISVFPRTGIVVTMTGAIEDGTEDAVYETVIKDFVIPAFSTSSDIEDPSPERLSSALQNLARNKRVLEGPPLEGRMIPSTYNKDRPVLFRP